MSINGAVSEFNEVFQDEVYLERSKRNIKLARILHEPKLTMADVSEMLLKRGISIEQSTISKYEKPVGEPNSTPPSMEYIRGLHMITGISINVLSGVLEWTDREIEISEETQEIVRMINNMSSEYRDMAETIIYVIYANEHAETVEEIRRIILNE